MKKTAQFHFLCFLLPILFFLASACAPESDDTRLIVEDVIESVGNSHVPDRRLGWFNVQPELNGATVLLRVETDQPHAKEALLSRLQEQGISVEDHVDVLPDPDLGENRWGIVNISVANLRARPQHTAELVTQATLGTPVKLLKRQGGFFLVQIPDGYVAWIDNGGVYEVSETRLPEFEKAKRVIYLDQSGVAYEKPDTGSLPVSDLVSGNILEFLDEQNGFFRVVFPDGREAYVAASEAQLLDSWLDQLNPTGESLVQTARGLMGLPYLWGGTSSKGVDCSGFTKSIYFLNGILLPRDADQQARAGLLVDDQGDFSRLKPGDLLFFGRAGSNTSDERIVHVGMWIGDNRFIHSSGRVRVSSTNPSDPDYDAYNVGRYLFSKRVLEENEGVQFLRDGLASAF